MRIRKTMWVLSVGVISLFYAVPAMTASQVPEIARKAGCMACHGIEGKIVGPGFAWVAYKYKDDKAKGKKAIVDQIVNGGKGQWTRYTGGIIMPQFREQTTEAQRNELADYILSLDPIAPPKGF
jgi:cytochrome c